MGMTYEELSVFGRLRKVLCLFVYSINAVVFPFFLCSLIDVGPSVCSSAWYAPGMIALLNKSQKRFFNSKIQGYLFLYFR
jgi:hypothetical protein